MKLIALVGSYRKGRTIDTLVDRAIEGVRAADAAAEVEKVYLTDLNMHYCRNCMACRNDDPAKPRARCVIDDDLQDLYPKLDAADAFILGSPVNWAHETAVMKTFVERITYVLTRPGRWPIPGCPTPRTTRRRHAIVIVSAGLVPPLLRRFCDEATSLLKDVSKLCLNARVVGSLYAGRVEKRGVEYYTEKAYRLGKRLRAACGPTKE